MLVHFARRGSLVGDPRRSSLLSSSAAVGSSLLTASGLACRTGRIVLDITCFFFRSRGGSEASSTHAPSARVRDWPDGDLVDCALAGRTAAVGQGFRGRGGHCRLRARPLGWTAVVLLKDEIGVFHALLAQSFFVAISILAIVTSRSFAEKRWADYEPHPSLRWWALAATALIFVQLGIGATMRHEHIGLSIPDFPSPMEIGSRTPAARPSGASMRNADSRRRDADGRRPNLDSDDHRILALLIAVAVGLFAWKARRSARVIRLWSWIWIAMILVQIGLGAWTIWSQKAADVATAHMALGALSCSRRLLTFRLFCGARIRDFVLPDAINRGLIERIA